MNNVFNGPGHDDEHEDIESRDQVDERAKAEEQLTLADEDERLPWLESDDDYSEDSVDVARLVMVGLIGLLAVLGLLGLAWWFSQPDSDDELLAEGSTIEAPEEPFRTRPDDPGGSEVAGTGDMSFEVGEGQSRESQLAGPQSGGSDAAASPSIDRTQAAESETAAAHSSANTSDTARDAGSAVPVQVAAYSNRARAEQGWVDLRNRFDALSGLDHRVTQAVVDGATVYRLQALTGSEATADSVCRALRAAGGDCQVIR